MAVAQQSVQKSQAEIERIRALGKAKAGSTLKQETRDKIGAAHRGRKRAPEIVAKYVATLRSDETRQKLSEAAKKQWRDGRGWASSTDARQRASQLRRDAWTSGVYERRLKHRNADGTWAGMPT